MATDRHGGLPRRGRESDRHPDVELLDAYLDAHADSDHSTRSVDRHVRSCPSCQEAVTALRQVRADLARLAGLTMPADVAARIRAAIAASDTAVPRSPNGGVPDDRSAPIAKSAAAGLESDLDPELSPGDDGAPPRPDTSGLADRGEPPTGPGTGEVEGAPRPRAGTGSPLLRGDSAGLGRPAPGHPASGRGRGLGRRRGRLRPTGRGHGPRRDWLSIAATCMALVAFGAAVLTYRGLQIGRSDTATSAATEAAPAQVAQRNQSTLSADAAGVIMIADSGLDLTSADIVQHGRDLLDGRIPTVGWLRVTDAVTDQRGDTATAPSPPAGSDGDAAASEAAPQTRSGPAAVSPDESLVRLVDSPHLRMCYKSLEASTGGRLLALDRVIFDRQPMLMAVLSLGGRPDLVQLFVVHIDCGFIDVPSAVRYTMTTKRI